MPGNTPNLNLPYPLPTEPVAQGADAIKALALSLDGLAPGAAHYFRVHKTATQSIATGTLTAVTWDAELYDPDNGFTSANPTKYFFPRVGLWYVRSTIIWAAASAGDRGISLHTSGGPYISGAKIPFPATAGVQAIVGCEGIWKVNALGEWVEVMCYQNTTNPLNLVSSDGTLGINAEFSAFLIGLA